MKKIFFILVLILCTSQTFAQEFTKYEPESLKKEHKTDGISIRHIAPAKMISYENNGKKDSFYFNTDGKLKLASSKTYSYEANTKKVIKKDNGKIVSEKTASPEFITDLKTKLNKALELLKK